MDGDRFLADLRSLLSDDSFVPGRRSLSEGSLTGVFTPRGFRNAAIAFAAFLAIIPFLHFKTNAASRLVVSSEARRRSADHPR